MCMSSALYNSSYVHQPKALLNTEQTMVNLNSIKITSPTKSQQVQVEEDLTISEISSVDYAAKSISTSLSGIHDTGAPTVAGQYNQPLLESGVNPTNNESLASNNPINTSGQGSNSAGQYDEEQGSSSKSGSTDASKNGDNSRKTNGSPSSENANLDEITGNTKYDKSDSGSDSHKSNHHIDSISKRHLTGDNNINKKMDNHKNSILEKNNDRPRRDKVPIRLPIPFP